MTRELGDVLHYFIPEPAAPAELEPQEDAAARADAPAVPLAQRLPIVAVPMGERDVVRAAFVWNLAVEVARVGSLATVVSSRDDASESLWPRPESAIPGAELVLSGARNLAELDRTAVEIAGARGAQRDRGLVLVRVPPEWIDEAAEGTPLLGWTLLFTTAEARDLEKTTTIADRLLRVAPGARVGVTVHGVRSIAEARDAFHQLGANIEGRLGREVVSYGLLLDDLHVYRAIVSHRPIGLAHPQSRAAKALGDVARLLLEDAGLEHAGKTSHG